MAVPTPRPISNKTSKEEANYRHYESCGTCGFYQHSGSCDVVDGSISPDCVCNKYAIREKLPEAKHADFYMNEYNKSKVK